MGLGDRCNARRPILGERTGGEDLGKLWCRVYWPQCSNPGGDDGEEVVGDSGGIFLRPGDGGGVLEPPGDGGRGGRLRGVLGRRGPGPELSEGVGGSPLLHAIEQ